MQGSSKPSARCKRVQDIGVWLQHFAVFVGVVSKSSPETVPGLMAYMIGIIRASQEYEGAAWAAYFMAFRRQTAASHQAERLGDDQLVTTYHLLHREG